MNTAAPALLDKQHYFFIGIAGAGMSALAQYLRGMGKEVSGSDRLFEQTPDEMTRTALEREGIHCYAQDGRGLHAETELVIISTAIEDTHPEKAKALRLGIPVVHRAELLAAICRSKRSIAIAGTSGKSTVTAMLFHILEVNHLHPSLISGAGLVSLQRQGKIGNACYGEGEWLVMEADESDGTLVHYAPEIGVLLNIDRDHKEVDELIQLFAQFRQHTRGAFLTNQAHALSRALTLRPEWTFGEGSALYGTDFQQQGFQIQFSVQETRFTIPAIGRHSMENALAATAAALQTGLRIDQAASALATYPGIYRRHQLLGTHKGITVIDDYAHNPAKIAASIRACQPIASCLIAWFQPHGFGPTRFIRNELVHELAQTLRPGDCIWMSEIYYAGGTAIKDISAADLIADLKRAGVDAHFVADRRDLFMELKPWLKEDTVLLLMGARDPGLEMFSKQLWEQIAGL